MISKYDTLILRPLINEKSMKLIKSDFYTFLVNKDATKNVVSKVVKAKYKVDVQQVRIINVAGKTKAQRTRKGYFTTPDIKKAIVKVKKGQKIPVFEASDAKEEEVEVRSAEGETIAKEKKSLLRGTKVKIEKTTEKEHSVPKKETGKPGKTKGEGK